MEQEVTSSAVDGESKGRKSSSSSSDNEENEKPEVNNGSSGSESESRKKSTKSRDAEEKKLPSEEKSSLDASVQKKTKSRTKSIGDRDDDKTEELLKSGTATWLKGKKHVPCTLIANAKYFSFQVEVVGIHLKSLSIQFFVTISFRTKEAKAFVSVARCCCSNSRRENNHNYIMCVRE